MVLVKLNTLNNIVSESSFFVSHCLALGVAAVVLSSGCGNESGFYDVSGTVQVDGKDVPRGMIIFSPDGSKDNSGPQGLAKISKGEITEVVRPIVGGPHWLEIQAYDGVSYEDIEGAVASGKRLIPSQQVQVDLPRSDVELAIDVHEQSDGKYSADVQVQD